MFNINRGYVGSSRSVRSQMAIEEYEVPISMFNRELIDRFIDENLEYFNPTKIKFLRSVAITKWKYVAKEKMGANSWHHTGKLFRETDHYSLFDVADRIVALEKTLDTEYKEYLQEKKEEVLLNYQYGVMEVNVFGGSVSRPKFLGTELLKGIVIGDWLYYVSNGNITGNGNISRANIYANKVVNKYFYDSYKELTENHRQFKKTKGEFNHIIKAKTKQVKSKVVGGK